MAALTGTGAGPVNILPAICGAASLVGKEYHLVTIGATDRTLIISAATSVLGLGVLCTAGAVGDPVTYYGPGSICLVKCGGTATRGVRAMSDAGDPGKAIDATGNVETFGTFLESGADGDLVRFQVNPLPAGTEE